MPASAKTNVGHAANTQVLSRSTSLAGNDRIEWPVTLRAVHRGYFRVGPGRLRSGDLFGFFEREEPVGSPADVVIVYPRTYTLADLGLDSARPFGDLRGGNRIFEDPSRVAGVRDYEPGDAMRRVDWYATARLGRLQSRTVARDRAEHPHLRALVAGLRPGAVGARHLRGRLRGPVGVRGALRRRPRRKRVVPGRRPHDLPRRRAAAGPGQPHPGGARDRDGVHHVCHVDGAGGSPPPDPRRRHRGGGGGRDAGRTGGHPQPAARGGAPGARAEDLPGRMAGAARPRPGDGRVGDDGRAGARGDRGRDHGRPGRGDAVIRWRQALLDGIFVATEAIVWFMGLRIVATGAERAYLSDLERRLQGGVAEGVVDRVAVESALSVVRAGMDVSAGPSVLLVIGVALAAFLLMRGIMRSGLEPAAAAAVLLLGSIAGLNVVLHLAVSGDLRVWDVSGFVGFLSDPSPYFAPGLDLPAFVRNPEVSGAHGGTLTVVFSGLTGMWLRFLVAARGAVTFERVLRSFTIGFLAALVLVTGAALAGYGGLARYVVPQFVLGALGLAVANHARATPTEGERRETPWATAV
ncbi:MAG: hypothetical protein CVU47_07595, partial [Chloroflexi bacterium HGW-Chloroflexi-9]